MCERIPELYVALPFTFEILRNIRSAVSLMEYDRRIADCRSHSEFLAVDCSRVVERFESGTRLDLCLNCADELVLLVVLAAADKCVNIARAVFDGNHRALDCRLLRILLDERVALVDKCSLKRIHAAYERHDVDDWIYLFRIFGHCN